MVDGLNSVMNFGIIYNLHIMADIKIVKKLVAGKPA
ncbi:unnamed protein product [Paramecium sonneborni]|uniref:Uncharacterized protein n=1 Tax=Paramecium sonneborni TaxID=65129 RepID=A0A8S1RLR6_9CILI|nr:unnamed protein product [Paramecium sonneborni]